MTEQEYEEEMKSLNDLLGHVHERIQQIADMEASGALARSPQPFTNPALTAAKDRAINTSSKIIDEMQRLHREWTTGQQ